MKTQTRKRSFAYRYVTAGEALYGGVRQWMFSDVASDHMHTWLGKIEYYAEELHEFLEQATALWLTSRMVAFGRSMHAENGRHYKSELRPFLKEYLVISRDETDDLERLLAAAVDASLQDMSSNLKSQVRQFAGEHHPHCYICGVILDFTQQDKLAEFTREHIWPQSLGGDSVIENLLPACGKCNGLRKMNYATWAMTSIQSISAPKNPTEDNWKNLQLSHFYAMHHFAGQSLAIERRVTLKEAFMQIGPWRIPPRFTDNNDVGHFFNLQVI